MVHRGPLAWKRLSAARSGSSGSTIGAGTGKQAADGTAEISRTIAEVSGAADGTTGSIVHINSAANDLTAMAEDLQRLVG